ncbi:MAG: hypothetical protein K2K73_01650, partial [Ureaplasma sp.]|nr:hypothetical protein [Ureaplasma sp.]
MTKTKKIAIGLLSTFGVSLLVSAPLLILSSTKNNHEVTEIQNATQRYKLSNWLIETKNDIELLSYFFSINDINSCKLKFCEKNIDKLKVKKFFKRILFDIFK